MTIYAASFSVAGVNAANTVLANLKAGAADRLKLLQVLLSIETAPSTPPVFQLERMNAVGTGAITSTAGAAFDSGEGAAVGVLETAWATTRPTRLATPLGFGRIQLPVTQASAFVFDFTNRPLVAALSGGLMLVMTTASGATVGQIGGTFIWDE